jgi:hypothetical protein
MPSETASDMDRRKFLCERVRRNNGIVEVLWTRIEGEQDELVLVNVIAGPDRYQEGRHYWIHIEPAFPH